MNKFLGSSSRRPLAPGYANISCNLEYRFSKSEKLDCLNLLINVSRAADSILATFSLSMALFIIFSSFSDFFLLLLEKSELLMSPSFSWV